MAHIGICSLLLCGAAYIYGMVVAIPGILVGLITGVAYFFYHYYQIERLTKMSDDKAPAYIRWGWMGRFGLLIFILALLGYHRIDVVYAAFITGFFVMPVILFINITYLLGQQISEAKKLQGKARGNTPWGMAERRSESINY